MPPPISNLLRFDCGGRGWFNGGGGFGALQAPLAPMLVGIAEGQAEAQAEELGQAEAPSEVFAEGQGR